MQIRVLGCSGSIGGECRTTAFLLDRDVLIDAGTGVGDLTLEELGAVDHILISHSHLDHILSIGLLADSVMRLRRGREPIQVHALPATIDALRTHIFNGVIWPDFTRLPSAEAPILRLLPFEVGQTIDLGNRRIEVLPAEHTVPAVGFAVLGAPVAKRGAFIYTGDTGPNPALWTRLHGMRIGALVIETAFRDEERQLARVSRHLCPAALGQELARLEHPTNVFITHIKPGEMDAVMTEIAALNSPHRIRALVQGQVIALE
ncbi:MAG: 3',5'-cyclic-nucleotide phosphodiesterase [Ideonella sp.]|nr:3',5'-cyclic-nucleotide phosphodiesterase [Ideonella sp.]MCC7455945.1 3',5'-cyclic-nucleotide phosphodiesterase [Nitrospira sp.]